jgi:hypothetical protein
MQNADMRHVSILVLRKAAMTEPAPVTFNGGLLVGRSSAEVCAACCTSSDAGCHPRVSSRSYDRAPPFGPSVGLASSVFALDFTVGPGRRAIKPLGRVPLLLVISTIETANVLLHSYTYGMAAGHFP